MRCAVEDLAVLVSEFELRKRTALLDLQHFSDSPTLIRPFFAHSWLTWQLIMHFR